VDDVLNHNYKSILAPCIEGHILEKKSLGYVYDTEARILMKLDEFCVERGYSETLVTHELATEWAMQRSTEGINYRNKRVSCLRQLSIYMNSMGINSYIPKMQMSEEAVLPHIPNARELGELFDVIDRHAQGNHGRCILAAEYPALFRLYYCCGLRLSEGCHLTTEDVDLEKGILMVRQSKGRKDRLVFMADNVAGLLKRYDCFISERFPGRLWFFPGAVEGKPFRITSIDRKFGGFWNLTESSKTCEKAPTVHSLRYAFICDRMNAWMEQGISLDAMMPYLSRYVGHAGIDETMYYYHMVQRAFKIVRAKDERLLGMMPEVKRYER